MRLTRLYINGFGRFHDLRIDGLSPGLTVFLGRNESGKTTLLNFIRAMLFGFPDGRSNENPFPPLFGGRHGGNLTLVTADEETFLLERYPGPRGGRLDISKPDPSQGGNDRLGRLLGPSNKTLFRNVYAFSLSELQDFDTLDTDAVRETLYSAGAGINPQDMIQLKGELDKRASDLFKPGGIKPKINAVLARLWAIQQEKQAIYGNMDRYDEIQGRIEECTHLIQQSEKRHPELCAGLKRIEQRIQAWPDWVNLRLIEEKLEKHEPIDTFPPQGLLRLEHLKSRLEEAEKAFVEKQEDLHRLQGELTGLKTNSRILGLRTEILELQRNQGRFEALQEDLQSLDAEIVRGRERLREDLGRLGPQWDENGVLAFDLSLSLREEIRHHREALAGLEKDVQREKIRHEGILARCREVEEAFSDLREPDILSARDLEALRTACRRLDERLGQCHMVEHDLSRLEQRLAELKEERGILQGAAEREEKRMPFWPVAGLPAAGLIYGAWSWFHGRILPAVGVFGGTVLGALSLWVSWRETRRRRVEILGNTDILLKRIGEMEKRRAVLDGERAALQRDMEEARCLLGLQEIPAAGDMEPIHDELADRIDHLKVWIRTRTELELIRERRAQSGREMEETASCLEAARVQWRNWLEDRGLDSALSTEGALEALGLMGSCRSQINALQRSRERRISIHEVCSRYRCLAERVLGALDRPLKGDLRGHIQDLVEVYLTAEQAEEKRRHISQEMTLGRKSEAAIRGRIEDLKGEIRVLLASGGAEEEERFREKALVFERRKALRTDWEAAWDNIKRILGPSEDPEALVSEFSKTGPEDLALKKSVWEQDILNAEETLDRLKKEQAALEEQARQLAQDERMSVLRAEEEDLLENLSNLADEWAVLKLAQGLIRGAGENYEKECQPAVISEAETFFEHLTLGAYPSLVAPFGETRIEVISREGGRKEIGHLSRGTAEQLYLSLRFGFVREFSRRSEPLPIIMDDILVNFDPLRAGAAVQAILQLSKGHQIFFFTCHPQTADLFRRQDTTTPVLEIAGHNIKE
ncbi:MAG: AAA family ATPase [Desulfatiglandales bacterium]